jgi:hypothetical protein
MLQYTVMHTHSVTVKYRSSRVKNRQKGGDIMQVNTVTIFHNLQEQQSVLGATGLECRNSKAAIITVDIVWTCTIVS